MEHARRFVAWLEKLDRAANAELRRSLAFEPGAYPRVYPYVEPFIRKGGRRALYLVAGLHALYRQAGGCASGSGGGNREVGLGTAAAELYARRQRSPSIEARFVALLDADSEQLPHRLRHMVTLLRSEQISLDWPRLLKDLLGWEDETRQVQQWWARDFYRATAPDETEIDEEEAGQ
ncbi:MAG: type I-E CRISPR-associated protein Cse2/CasB [Candidatus Bipolaricaulota bacterium]